MVADRRPERPPCPTRGPAPADGGVLVAGGRTCNGPPPLACSSTFTTNTAEIYDPATGRWTPTASMNTNRTTTSAVLLQNGTVLVPAGFPGGQNTAETYNPLTGTWTPTGNLNIARARQGAMLLPDGTALVAAGAIGGTPPLTSETYDPATNTWTYAGNLAQPRFNFFFTELPNGEVLIAGGAGPGANPSTTAEVFDPVTRTWSSAGTLPAAFGSSSSSGSSTRMVVLTGRRPSAGTTAARCCWWATTPPAPPPSTAVVVLRLHRHGNRLGRRPDRAGRQGHLHRRRHRGRRGDVPPGGSVVLNGAQVNCGVVSQGSTGVRICGSQIRNASGGPAVSVAGTVGPVVIGDGTAGCARNDIVGLVSLDGNHSVELDTNRVSGSVSVANTSGSPHAPVVAANQITGNLTCTDNVPPPTNQGRPNTVFGTVSGDCAPAWFPRAGTAPGPRQWPARLRRAPARC